MNFYTSRDESLIKFEEIVDLTIFKIEKKNIKLNLSKLLKKKIPSPLVLSL